MGHGEEDNLEHSPGAPGIQPATELVQPPPCPKCPGGFPSSNQSRPCTRRWGAEWILEEWQPSVGGCSLKFLLFNLKMFVCLHVFMLSRDLMWIGLVFFWHHKYLCSPVYSYVHQSSWVRPVDLLMSILSQTAGSMFWGSSFSQVADHRSCTKISASGNEFFVIMW